MDIILSALAIKTFFGHVASSVLSRVASRALTDRLKPGKAKPSTALTLAQQRYLGVQAQAQAGREERGLELRERGLELQACGLELQKLHLALLHQHQQQNIALALEKIQADYDLAHWSGLLSRNETVQLLTRAQAKPRLLLILSEPDVSPNCPDTFRHDFPREARAEVKQFVEHHYPLGSELYPVEFFGKLFKFSVFDTEVKQLESLLAGVPAVVLYSDFTDEKLYLHLYAWGWDKPLSETVDWNWEESKDALLADGLSEKQALREIRKAITALYQLFAALLADLYYLSVNPLHEPRSLHLDGGLADAALAPYLDRLREVQQQILRDSLPPPDIHGWPTQQVQVLQKLAAEALGLPVVFQDRLSSGGLGPKMAVIPAGSFLMGSPPDEPQRYSDEGPQHRVSFAQPFAIGVYAVTFDEYDRFCDATGREKPSDSGWGRGSRPVTNVSWEDAQAYCQWLSLQTGKTYRLPSEAEWEYAARAGTSSAYWWGDQIGDNRANCDGSGSQWSKKQTAPVGSFPANPWGLHDTVGNVREWVQDKWHGDYTGAPADGSAWQTGDEARVVRGGSWFDGAGYVRCAYRLRHLPGDRYSSLGLRLVLGVLPGDF